MIYKGLVLNYLKLQAFLVSKGTPKTFTIALSSELADEVLAKGWKEEYNSFAF